MKYILYFFSLVFLVSCTGKTIYKKPKNLIPKDSMVLLLSDMLFASSTGHIGLDDYRRDIDFMPLVYEKYKIDSTRFFESNLYYTSLIADYEKLLKEVEKKMKEKRDFYEKKVREKDSLDNIKTIDSAKVLEIDSTLLQKENFINLDKQEED